MTIVNMHEAKTNLSRLVEALVSGAETEITIARNGKPAVRMVPVPTEKPKRRLGLARGKFEFDYEAFQALDAEVQRLFEAEAERKAKPYGERGCCSTRMSRSGPCCAHRSFPHGWRQ